MVSNQSHPIVANVWFVAARKMVFLCGVYAPTVAFAGGYYDSVDASSPEALRATLHEVIDDHQRYPYTSSTTDTWDILELAEQDPNDPRRIIDVYRNASYVKIGGGVGVYNREHTWPNSYGYPNDNASNYRYTCAHAVELVLQQLTRQ